MKTMQRLLIWTSAHLLLAGCGLFQGNAERVITGSGRVTSETRSLAPVDSVVLAGQGEVVVQEGAAQALTIEAEDNLLPLITSEVQGSTLRLGFDRPTWRDTIRPTRPIRFVLTVPELRSFDLSGSGNLHANNLHGDSLTLRITGAGEVLVEHLDTGALAVHLDGTGTVTLAGRVEEQSVEITGSGQYHAGDLDSQVARVTISGTGDAVVWVRADLAARISGSGSVSYWGDPTVSQRDISGTGDINPMGVK